MKEQNTDSHLISNPSTNHETTDPLSELKPGPDFVRDVQNISKIILLPEPGDQFWQTGARWALSATIMHVFYTEESKSLHAVKRLLLEELIGANASEQGVSSHGLVRQMLDASYPDDDVQQFIKEFAHELESAGRWIPGGWVNGAIAALDSWEAPAEPSAGASSMLIVI